MRHSKRQADDLIWLIYCHIFRMHKREFDRILIRRLSEPNVTWYEMCLICWKELRRKRQLLLNVNTSLGTRSCFLSLLCYRCSCSHCQFSPFGNAAFVGFAHIIFDWRSHYRRVRRSPVVWVCKSLWWHMQTASVACVDVEKCFSSWYVGRTVWGTRDLCKH